MMKSQRIKEAAQGARRVLGHRVWMCMMGVLAVSTSAFAAPFELTVEEKQTVTVGEATEIYVKNARGKTIILGRKDLREVLVRASKFVRAKDSEAAENWMTDLTFRVDRDGNQISIITDHPDRMDRSENFWAFIRGIKNTARIDYTIEVPSGFDAEVSTTSGGVQVTSLDGNSKVFGSSGDVFLKDLGGEAHVEVSSGDVEIVNVAGNARVRASSGDAVVHNAGGSMDFQATSGDLEAHGLEGNAFIELASGDFLVRGCGGDIIATTISGDGVISEVGGNVKTSAASGDMYLKVLPVGGREFVVNTSSGDVRLTFFTADDYGFMLDVATSSGTIEGDLDISVDKISRRVLRGIVGNGESKVLIETASGDIKITQAELEK